jgi:hypothetical protein
MSRTRCRPEGIAATALAAGHLHQRRESASPEAEQTSLRSGPSAEGRACRSAVVADDASTQDRTPPPDPAAVRIRPRYPIAELAYRRISTV